MPKRKRESVDGLSTDVYAPLSQTVDSSFRVCTLLPGEDGTPVQCKLLQDDWKSVEAPYEAISYVWGDHTPAKTIHLNGNSFQVGINLETLLRQLRGQGRGKTKQRRLWIDAICIDQANLVERSQQVQSMYEIYHAASQVVVWLGDTHSGSELAFNFMNKHLKPCLESVGFSCTDEQGNAVKAGFWDKWDESKDAETLEAVERLVTRKYAKSWAAVAKLLLRPWWNRAWTVQELISARKVSVHCGPSAVPWPLMEMTIQLMLRNIEVENLFPKKENGAYCDAIEDAHAFAYERYHRVLGGHGPESFPQLMQVTRCRQSQDPRDKVFSILSLLDNDSTQYHFQPDYSEPVHVAYARAARAHIQSSNNLHILSSCCYLKEENPSSLPSWVPSWEKSVEISYLGGYSAKDAEFNYAASGSSLAEVTFTENPEVLSAQGILIDTVKNNRLQASDSEFDYLYTSAKEEPWLSWDIHDIVKRLEGEPTIVRPEGETILKAVLRTLIADRHPETGKRRHEIKLRRIMRHLWPKAEDLEGFLSHTQMFAVGRTLVLSENGYIGLAPSETETGDKICVMYGCHAPVVLRKRSDGADAYILVGDAYVHGLMDGEALQLVEKRPDRRREFMIE
jgi:Heterokaryon incompatibility protein (HET)